MSALSSKVIQEFRSRYKARSLTNLGGIISLEELATSSSDGLDDFHKHTVFKCGRTTGETRAVLNSIDSSVQMSYVDNVSIVVRTLVVLSPPKTKQTWRGPCGGFIAFGTKGDSGSLVFDYRGKVLGTYFGGQVGNPNSHDYDVVPRITGPSVDGIHFVSPIGPTLDGIQAAVRNDPAFGGLDVNVEFLWGPSD